MARFWYIIRRPPRQCVACGRYLRNPTDYCHRHRYDSYPLPSRRDTRKNMELNENLAKELIVAIFLVALFFIPYAWISFKLGLSGTPRTALFVTMFSAWVVSIYYLKRRFG